MILRPILLGAILCLVLVNRASAQCLCASKGLDFCSCAAVPPLRPVPKVVPRLPLAKFPPIGDSCWCGKKLVEPAIPPKPVCKVCDTFEWLSTLKTLATRKFLNKAIALKQKCIGKLQQKLVKFETLAALAAALPEPAVPVPGELPPPELAVPPPALAVPPPALAVPPPALALPPPPPLPLALLPAAPPPPPPAPCKCSCECCPTAPPAPKVPSCFDAYTPPAPAPCARPPGIPADPLSISMALTASKSFAVPEAKLSYGPVAAPLNAVQKIFFSNIPEEKLYGLNAGIIEMKKKFPLPTKAELLAEALEDAEEEQAAAVAAPAPYLTYADLGYGPALIKKPNFLQLSAQPALGLAAAVPKPILPGCSYIPGKITTSPEYLEQPLQYGAPCL